mmetsp:Transcript_14750/g.21068  ORF Transcript_14750/g.21068 Transcript_14750/m.21068 type:complete len:287 (+) Transcript_14750:121-981(+)
MVKALLLNCFFSLNLSYAFAPQGIQRPVGSQLKMCSEPSKLSRRAFYKQTLNTAAISATLPFIQSTPAYALGGGKLSKVNAKLKGYGLPLIENVPDGFSPLVEVWGRGANREPLLVQFSHPLDWVVTLPSQDVNGEDGTIQAGEYAKGDTATFFVYSEEGKIDNITEKPKDFFANAIIKAISQKGNNIYQNFKVTKVQPRQGVYEGQDYVTVDFKYELLTGAGFEVDRVGVASLTSVGSSVEVLWSASTRQRYKKTEDSLRKIADSFRCYSGGLDGSRIVYEDTRM